MLLGNLQQVARPLFTIKCLGYTAPEQRRNGRKLPAFPGPVIEP